jgi:peptide/nickel transport system permease protein
MQTFILRRLVQSILVLVGVSIFVFGLLQLSGNPVGLLLPPDATAEQKAVLEQRYGFDQPIYVQYFTYARGVIVGDFGDSMRSGQAAMPLVLERLPATFELAGAAMLFTVILSFPAGIIAALHRGKWIDRVVMMFALLGQSLPVFFVGILFILIFGVRLDWFPVSGRGGLSHLVLPALSLGLYGTARTARLVRSGMLDVMRAEFVTTARAKGLTEATIVYGHVLRNALIPIITVLGLDLATLLGGAIITETIFSWPGLGRLIIYSIEARDYPVVQAAVFVVAVAYILVNFIVDVLYAFVNPRVRFN